MQLVFIGFGEAAYHIASGLKAEGLTDLGAYDRNAADPQLGGLIQQRAAEVGVKLFESLESAYQAGEFIACLTSANSALAVAKSVIPQLKAGQVYIDMNSAAPTVKAEIAQIPHNEGVMFCDAAVMGTVPGNKHKVPMFLAGNGAAKFAAAFSQYGMKLTVLDAQAGGASAIKMFKSVIMKGLPQLMFESFEAAVKYGVLNTLVDSLASSLNGKTVEQLADTFTARTMIHAARRSEEMQDVVATLENLGVDAAMSKATVAKLDLLAKHNWVEILGTNGDKMSYQEAMKALIENKE
ncbi:NAD(P)-dependent oxidoreductase [Anaerospora hongkongensis]|uniref:NAD(P)-dependent oxidoreductase n=1 Tax=Anaerospora hongkongensis TaxID=244830 RepID=UPI002FD87D42